MSGSLIEISGGLTHTSSSVPRFERSLARGRRRLMLAGSLVVLLGVGALGGWASLAPLRGAALAPGVVKVAGERRVVQHLEGGIVREILVREGESVAEGQVLLRLVDVIARARIGLLRRERDTVSAEIARVEAELDGLAELRIGSGLSERRDVPEVARLVEGEIRLFRNRRDALLGQIEVLEQQQASDA